MPPRRLLDPKVARAVAAIVQRHVGVAVATMYDDPEHRDPEMWRLGIEMGIVVPGTLRPAQMAGRMVEVGMFLGHVEAAGKPGSRYGTTIGEFLAEVAKHPVPTTPEETQAADSARAGAGSRLRGLGNRFTQDLTDVLIEADQKLRRDTEGIVNDVLAARYGDDDALARLKARGVKEGKTGEFYDGLYRGTIGDLRSALGHATGDWTRDWTRIAQTEAQTHIQQGKAEVWKEEERAAAVSAKEPPRSTLVYKIPRPDACEHCKRLHLDGGHPRVFKLEDILGNGTNIGRKRAAWRVVAEATHPYCACELLRVPASIRMPSGWRSGQAAPGVVMLDGTLSSAGGAT